MTESLESLLGLLCKSVNKAQQNAQQTLYILTDVKDAKLAYDLLMMCGLDAKYFPDDDTGKLYVQNDSLAASEEKLRAMLASAPLFKHIKNLLDQHSHADYSLSFTNTPAGRQLTVLLPMDKSTAAVNTPRPASAATQATPSIQVKSKAKMAQKKKDDEQDILAGPSVARKAIPAQFKTSATDEDPLSKRIMLYASGRAFTSGAWVMFVILVLGIIFSVLVTLKGFMCPDVATDQKKLPSYCPQKVNNKPENAPELQ